MKPAVWAPASQKTYSIYMLGNGWSTLPTNTELYIEVEYFDEAGTAHKATVKARSFNRKMMFGASFRIRLLLPQKGLLRIRAYLTKVSSERLRLC